MSCPRLSSLQREGVGVGGGVVYEAEDSLLIERCHRKASNTRARPVDVHGFIRGTNSK